MQRHNWYLWLKISIVDVIVKVASQSETNCRVYQVRNHTFKQPMIHRPWRHNENELKNEFRAFLIGVSLDTLFLLSGFLHSTLMTQCLVTCIRSTQRDAKDIFLMVSPNCATNCILKHTIKLAYNNLRWEVGVLIKGHQTRALHGKI